MLYGRRTLGASFWIGFALLVCAVGMLLELWLVPFLAIKPGFEHPPQTWFDNVIALQLPARIVVVNLVGSLPIIAVAIATVALAGLAGNRFVAGLASVRYPERRLVAAQLCVSAVLALFPLTLSSDAYGYMLWGHIFGLHGINPYLDHHLFVHPGGDGALARLSQLFGQPLPWGDDYGPLFTLWAGFISRTFGASLNAEFAVQRIVAIVAAAALTLGLLRLLRGNPERVRQAGAFAFHPLVLLETAVNGHNDIVMAAFAVGAFALAEDAPLLAGVLFGASIAVKTLSIVVFPFFVALLVKRSGMRGWVGSALAAGVVALSFQPFWFGWHTIGGLSKGYQYFFSPTYLLNMALFGPGFDERFAGHAAWPHLISLAMIAAFAVFATIQLVRFVRAGSPQTIFATMVGFVWSVPIFNPWYFVWLAPVVAWPGSWSRYVAAAMWIALLYYPLHYGVENGALFGQLGVLLTVATFFGPLLLLVPAVAERRRTRALVPQQRETVG